LKIDKKITGYKVMTDKEKAGVTPVEPIKTLLTRPEVLNGATYKIKPLVLQHGLYITINNTIVDDKILPYELLITTKNIELFHFMEVLSLTITTLFRLQQDISHLLEEYGDIPAIGGGYWSKPKVKGEKGKFYKSFIGEIANVIKGHLEQVNKTVFVQVEDIVEVPIKEIIVPELSDSGQVCSTCGERTAVLIDGCLTCLSCGESKCS
jgi:hypothetical protein